MLPLLNFYGNHDIDFVKNDSDFLKFNIVSLMRQIPIHDVILQMAHASLLSQFPGQDLSKFYSIGEWSPIAFPAIASIRNFHTRNISLIGPLAMNILFTPNHIFFPSFIRGRTDWYSPLNREKVQAHRSYFYTVINQFGGNHALYVDERIEKKFNYPSSKSNDSALADFEQALIARYGTNKKTIFDFPHGKYPKYYIDYFTDIVQTHDNYAEV